ncbi:hypothetical protein QAD02_020570 [Eretmocerus hayati]|uniref:Uncharacterized protein n=1 Tax=Eretmocerus hayati TaxID=131215 RepID=A0ACC2PR02_9HYME|nr:hypothetical protein QAD02_020570 [Eretmocerus hayati]
MVENGIRIPVKHAVVKGVLDGEKDGIGQSRPDAFCYSGDPGPGTRPAWAGHPVDREPSSSCQERSKTASGTRSSMRESTTFDKGKASKIPSLPHKNEKNCILSVSTLSDLAEKAGTVIDAISAFVRVKDGIKELNTSELEIQKMKVVRRLLPRDVQISQVVNLQAVTNDILLGKNCSGICR